MKAMKRLSASELDGIGLRLDALAIEEEGLRDLVRSQIQEHGFSPPKSEKSRRLEGLEYRFTLSTSTTTEVRDAEVEQIREKCSLALFQKLFVKITKYKLASGATALLAGILPEEAPRSLRQMFAKAVITTEGAPRLRVEKIGVEVPA
jgi:hypothetical protein